LKERRKMMKNLLFNGRLSAVVCCLMALFGILAGSANADMTIILTPSKDNYINRCSVSGNETNYGGAEKLLVRSFDGIGCSLEEPKSARTIIRFDTPDIRYPVAQATLGLYYYDKLGSINPVGRTYEVRRLLNDWTEGTGTKPATAGGTTLGSSWQNRHNFGGSMKFPWDSNVMPHIEDTPPCAQGCSGWDYLGGGDSPYTDCNGTDHWGGDEVWATAVVPASFSLMEWDVTALVQGWYAGSFSNNGLLIQDAEEQWHSPCLYPDDNKFGAFLVHFFIAKSMPMLITGLTWKLLTFLMRDRERVKKSGNMVAVSIPTSIVIATLTSLTSSSSWPMTGFDATTQTIRIAR
jgi:hypothetical protein